ncbi:MAG TPA: hypothetical protein VLW49_09435 [Gaiellaceae bacterium]|nr:hypothetical protein [Gaiellaceae bacterium]
METIQAGQSVLARDAVGDLLVRRAVSGIEFEDGHQIVWLCNETEWAAAAAEGRDPDAFAWPAEDVQAA